jgi:hypothetical protein
LIAWCVVSKLSANLCRLVPLLGRVRGEVELQEVCLEESGDEDRQGDDGTGSIGSGRGGRAHVEVCCGRTVGGGGGRGAGKKAPGEGSDEWTKATVNEEDDAGGPERSVWSPSGFWVKLHDVADSAEVSLATATATATDALGYFVVRFRVVIIAAGVVSTIAAAAVVATGLRIARVPPPLLRPDTNLQRIQHLLFDVFYTESWANVKVVFGVAGVDRSTADPNDPSSFGQPVWDPAFNFESAGVQLAVGALFVLGAIQLVSIPASRCGARVCTLPSLTEFP